LYSATEASAVVDDDSAVNNKKNGINRSTGALTHERVSRSAQTSPSEEPI
jgi:hypothetical protein